MRVEEVDERDSAWEDDHPRFRVYIFESHGDSGERESYGTTATYDLTECDALDAVMWAQGEAGPMDLYAVALVGEHYGAEAERGLTWLVGADDVYADDRDRAADPLRAARLARMMERRGKRIRFDP